MTVFSTVTATLSPELASCMKAKGKSWKDAFFNSLKTLVGVDYAIYRKENQWQIKGEWDGIKKAFNILTKVAFIEKDAIAAYHAETSKHTDRACGLLSAGLERGSAADAAGRRRRGRPPKKRPYIPPQIETQQLDVPLPPKRKRGRPRKVRPEDVKPEPESDFDDEATETEILDSENEAPATGFTNISSDGITASKVPDAVSEVHIKGQVPQPQHASVGPPVIPEPRQLIENPQEFVQSLEQAEADKNQTPGDIGMANTQTIQDNSFPTDNSPVAEHHNLHTTQVKVEQSSDDMKPVTEQPENSEENIQEAAAVLCDLPSIQEERQESAHKFSTMPNDNLNFPESNNEVQQPPPSATETVITDADQFSSIVMEVAKEAIACTSNSILNEARSLSESVGHVMVPPMSTPSMLSPTLPGMAPVQTMSDIHQPPAEPQSNILEYLGIKHKATFDDFNEENDKFSSEQSKKLEELIEKMIEKMDKTLKEPKPAPTGLKYICTECPFTSHKKNLLRDHMRKAHKDEDLEPEKGLLIEEPQASTASTSVVPHKKFVVARKLYRCYECTYSSNSRKHLKEHKLRKHREKSLECDVCQKKFAIERDLQRHMKDHSSKDERHACRVCGKKYKQMYVLKRHEETHKEGYVKPVYSCPQCPKSFSAKQVLQAHLDSVHLGKRVSLPCSVCGKTFTSKHSLSEHQLIHSNVKPYECTICKKSFRHESTLKTHKRLHTDTTQQFTCEYCGKAFRLRSSLRIHRNIHTAEKRFDCPVCKKVFTQKQSLLRHARIHTGEKPFQCEICGSAFYDYSILRRHVTGVHKMQWKSPTQHYVLPPNSYHEGKVIEQAPQNTLSSALAPQVTTGLVQSHVGESLQVTPMSSLSHHAPQQSVYQPSPMSHTPNTLPEATSTVHQPQVEAHNLTTRHLSQTSLAQSQIERKVIVSGTGEHHIVVTDPQTLEHKVLIQSDSEQQAESVYHSGLVSAGQAVYQSPHIALTTGIPSALPPHTQQNAPPPGGQHQSSSLQSPAPSQQAMSPMSPLSMSQYQQAQNHAAQSTHTPLSAYVLNQQIYYQSHQQ